MPATLLGGRGRRLRLRRIPVLTNSPRPSWSQVIQHYLLQLFDTILETKAFDNV